MADEDYSTEEWRQIPSAPGYSASSLGRIRRDAGVVRGPRARSKRFSPQRILVLSTASTGYLICNTKNILAVTGVRSKTRCVHHLVSEVFLGQKPTGLVVNHKNSIRSDNRPHNLEYVTQAGNIRHMLAAGRGLTGSKCPWAKLTEAQVIEIRGANGTTEDHIFAERFGLSREAIGNARRGRSWKRLS